MRITLHGAAGGEVTGSAYIVETDSARVLIDCGLFQGGRQAESKNRAPIRANARLDAVLLTHGHLDHTGRLPLLARLGYKGPVYATPATIDMTGLILRDSARIQMSDVARKNRKRERAGQEPLEPLYESDDAEAILGRLRPVPYQKPISVAKGVTATWAESGHMLGSASLQLTVEEQGKQKRVVFSGDLGPKDAPMLRNYEPFAQADLIFMESTYGDRDHRAFKQTVHEFVEIVRECTRSGGKMLIPTFAVGRAQLLITLCAWMFRTKKVPPFAMFLDSPMAIEATEIYRKHPDLYGKQLAEFVRERRMSDDLKLLKTTATADESRAINRVEGTAMVMAGAGMCNAGRILHHLKAHLWKPSTHVIIVGYQGPGSLGRMLVDGADTVKIFGESVAVKAKVHTLGGFSAHAGQTDLVGWLEPASRSRPRLVLTHGEDRARKPLAKLIEQRYGIKPILPGMGDAVVL
jgi:metallo-beta-lactamase family protein